MNVMFVKRFFIIILIFAIQLTNINCVPIGPQEARIKVNPKVRFQTITGWEATAQVGEQVSAAYPNYKDELFNQAVNDLGINRLRLEIYSGAENPKDIFADYAAGRVKYEDWREHFYEVVNDNDDPFKINPQGFQFSHIDSTIEKIVIPVRELLAKRGESLYLNLNYVDFGCCRGSSSIRHNNNPEEYAELMLAAYQHIKTKYGFVPDAVEVILEPDNKTGWTGKQIGEAIVATAKRLEANGFKPAFIVPSTTNAANAPVFIDQIAEVDGAMQYVTEFSYHRYCCASEEVLQRIADRSVQYKKQTSMLEWIGADYNTLHQDLKLGYNSSWQQFTLAGPLTWGKDDGSRYYLIDDKDAKKPVLTMAGQTKFFRQYFRYIRTGSQRIGAETSNVYLDPLAFINADGRYVVVVKAEATGSISVEGLPAGNYGISYTTSNETDVNAPDVSINKDQVLTAKIPSAGVLTIYSKKQATEKNE